MRPPNLLFIFTDEQRYDTLACYGNRRIEMPNLNRLAARSVVFERAYCTQPVCTPSRSTLMTGLYPHSTGCTGNNVPLRAETATLPELFDSSWYVTGYHGKWHLGDEIFAQHSFSDWVSIEDNYIDHYSPGRDHSARSSYHHFLLDNGFSPDSGDVFSRGYTARLPERFGKPAFLAREASRFIRAHQDRAFMLVVNFLEPHMPFFGPRDDQYDPAHVDLPPNFNDPPAPDQHLKARLCRVGYYENGHSGLPLKTETDWQRMIANYWGLNSLVDTHVGTILNTLEALDMMENTIIVFTSDHGDMMGSHQLLAKTFMFEEAVRIPLLIHLPGQTVQRHVANPVSQIDLVPTLLDLIGQPIPGHLQGKSRRAALEGQPTEEPDDVFIEWHSTETGILEGYHDQPLPPGLAELATPEQLMQAVSDPVRTVITPDGWKLSYSQIGQHELYHLSDDPYETKNRVHEPGLQPVVNALIDKIRRWQDETQDAV